jgi:hypothetical protein
MQARRLLHVKHFHFKGNPHVSQGGEHARLALQQDGHRIWGPVLYRSSYKSDTDWAEFMRRLQFRTQRFLEISHPPDLVDAFRLTVLEDQSAFEGAPTSAIRSHFKHWSEAAVEDEQGPGTHQQGAQRYRYCVQVDEEALDTVVRKAPGPEDPYALNTVGYARLISKDWKLYDPAMYLSGVKYLEDMAAPIEGCTLHNVGWMSVPYDNLVKVFRHLRGLHDWDYQYRRPPVLWGLSTLPPSQKHQL